MRLKAVRITASRRMYHAVRRSRMENSQRMNASVCLVADSVAGAPHSLDQLVLETLVNLAPQVTDVDIHHVRFGVEVEVPHVLGNLGAGEKPPRMANEVFEQAVFFGRQRDALVSAPGRTCEGIEREIAHAQFRRARIALAAGECAQ